MKLGDTVRFNSKLIRTRKYIYKTDKKEWKETQFSTPQVGILIGVRTLANGSTYYSENGCIFTPVEYFPVYMVATDLRKKPVFTKRIELVYLNDSHL